MIFERGDVVYDERWNRLLIVKSNTSVFGVTNFDLDGYGLMLIDYPLYLISKGDFK